MIELIFWILLSVFVTAYFFYWFYAAYKGAPFYPSSKKAISEIIKLVKTSKAKNIVELGSGDGRIAIALAKEGYNVTAIDINPLLTLWTKVIAKLKGVEINVVTADILKVDLNEFDLAVTYLFPEIMQKLYPKLKQELKPGATLISNTFKLVDTEPVQKTDSKILMYKI